MIQSEKALAVTRERLAKMERVLEALRKTARPEEWPALSSGYRLEIERMQGEILDYLVTPVSVEETAA
jgi:hypothetical protein